MWQANAPIRASELDPLLVSRGLVNVCGLLRIADEVCDDVFDVIGLGAARAMASGETVFTAAVHVNNFRPIGRSQTFYPTVAVSELGTKKFITTTRFCAHDGELLAEVQTVHVCYDLNKKRSIEIPADIVAKILKLLQPALDRNS